MKWSAGVRAGVRAGTLAVAVSVAATLAGCGGSDEQDEAAGDTLYERFGLPDYSDPASQAGFDDEQRVIEEAIAECMTGKGFEYQPMIYDSGEAAEYTEEDAVASARRYGLGVALQYNNPEYDAQMEAESEEFSDPNAEYTESLSEAERTAFYEALDGTPEELAEYETTETDPESGETYTVVEGAGAGCRGDAQRSVGGGDQAVYEALEPFQTEISERVDADPRIAEAEKAWSACMADKGFDYADEEAVYTYAEGPMRERLVEILGTDPNTTDPMAELTAGMTEEEAGAFYASKTQAELEQLYADAQDRLLENADLEALTVLQAEERDLAVASTECSQSSYTVYEEVYADIEAAYMAENEDRIAAAVAEFEQQPAPSSS